MAIARGTSINGGRGTSPFTTSSSITVNSGDVLVACVNSSPGSGDGDLVSSVVWDGGSQSMTQIGKQHVTDFGGTWVYLYFLANPTAATSTVTVTTSSGHNVYCIVGTYSGVKTSGQPSATSSATGNSPLTDTIAVVDSNSWTVMAAYGGDTISASTGTSVFQLGDFNLSGILDSNGSVASGNYNQTWTSIANPMGDASMALSPPGGGATPKSYSFGAIF